MRTTSTKPATVSSITMENRQEKKSKLKEKFPHLTDPDMDFEEVNMEEMIDKFHSEYEMTLALTNEELNKFIAVL
ncbi:MAG: hypothetical protein ABSG15_10890 [FCB group bacterium]|jgi:hypothetical protein